MIVRVDAAIVMIAGVGVSNTQGKGHGVPYSHFLSSSGGSYNLCEGTTQFLGE